MQAVAVATGIARSLVLALQGEAVVFGLQAPLQLAGHFAAPARAQLRQALVGREHGVGVVLQHLPALRAGIGFALHARHLHGLPRAQITRQQAWREAGQQAGKVLPVVVVGRRLPGCLVVQARLGLALVLHLQRRARAAQCLVMRQGMGLDAAFVLGLQVTELGRAAQAAPRRQRGGEREIVVGCQTPVIGHGQAPTAAVVKGVDGGWQPARARRAGRREADHRRRQDGHAQKAQHGTRGHAVVVLKVQIELPGAQHPVGFLAVVGAATGIAGAHCDQAVIAREIDATRTAARARAGNKVLRHQHLALACVELNLHLGTVEAVAVLLEMHIATRRHQLAAMLDFQCVGREQQPRLTQLNKPLGPGLLVDHALHALGLQHDGLITLACSSALSRPA